MKLEQKRTCMGLCKKYLAKKPHGVGRYESGQFRCQMCGVYISIKGTKNEEGLYCKCCNFRVRGNPRNRVYKDKLMNTKNQTNLEVKICPHCGKNAKGRREIETLFGFRNMINNTIIPQSYCKKCRQHDHSDDETKMSEKRITVSQDLSMVKQLNDLMKTKHDHVRELINIFTTLYEKHGTVSSVSKISGFSTRKVRKYVKYSRLPNVLKEAVKEGYVDLSSALRATDALNWDGDEGLDEKLLELATKMDKFTSSQKHFISKILKHDSSISISEAEKMMK